LILILAPINDVHALSVQSSVARTTNEDCAILDVADYPTKWRLSLNIGSSYQYHVDADDIQITSPDIGGIWRRRITSPFVDSKVLDTEVRLFAQNESRDFLSGFINHVDNVINNEAAESASGKKTLQLKVAREVGLRIPDTLISNDPDKILEFYEKYAGDVIFKTLTPTRFQFAETRMLEREHLEFLPSAVFCPTIYQELIHAKHHFRITIVDNEMFPAIIEPTKDYARLDWRLDHDPIIKCASLTADVEEKLIRLMRSLR